MNAYLHWLVATRQRALGTGLILGAALCAATMNLLAVIL